MAWRDIDLYYPFLFNNLLHIVLILTNWPKDKGIGQFLKKIKGIDFNEPFFMFMNLMEVHNPYLLNDTFHKDTIENLKSDYLDIEKVKIEQD